MKETRRLDVLAIIGGVLALFIAVFGIYFQERNLMLPELATKSSKVLLGNVRQADTKANLQAIVPRNGSLIVDVKALEEAARKYPDDPRLNLHMALFAKEPTASHTLRCLTKLDPENALPFYLLASKASSSGDWDSALNSLARADSVRRLDLYNFPLEMARGDGILEMELDMADSRATSRIYSSLRQFAKNAGKRAQNLHAAGNGPEAVALLTDVRQMGWALARRDGAGGMDAVVGCSIVLICNKASTRIGGQEELARIRAESKKMTQIMAGVRAYRMRSVDEKTNRWLTFLFLSVPMFFLLISFSICMLCALVVELVYVLRSKGLTASEFHNEVTARVYSSRRLLKLYGVLFLSACLPTLVLLGVDPKIGPISCLAIGFAMSPAIVFIVLVGRTSRLYRDTYRMLTEQAGVDMPAKWKGMPIQEWREFMRRAAGLDGGFVITLALWALLVSIGLKMQFNAYPWQITKAMGGMPQAEMKYVKDLVDGKVKVPQKYIDEVKSDEAQHNVQRSTLNSQSSRRD